MDDGPAVLPLRGAGQGLLALGGVFPCGVWSGAGCAQAGAASSPALDVSMGRGREPGPAPAPLLRQQEPQQHP